MECEFCHKPFSTKYVLVNHQQNTKSCLILQGKLEKQAKREFRCKYCDKVITSNANLKYHENICDKKHNVALASISDELQLVKRTVDRLIEEKQLLTKQEEVQIKEETLNHRDIQTTYSCDIVSSDLIVNKPIVENKINDTIQPLVIHNYHIVYRKEDGYIDVTNLCKAGGKEFKSWTRLKKSQSFLLILSNEVGIHTSKLIEVVSGGNSKNQGTWAHPLVAINIAQWISPELDVKVSKWILHQ